jgi:hypothetical protein
MPMGAKNTRSFSLLSKGSIEVPIDKKTGAGLEGCVFNSVPVIGTLLVDDWIKRGSARKRI